MAKKTRELTIYLGGTRRCRVVDMYARRPLHESKPPTTADACFQPDHCFASGRETGEYASAAAQTSLVSCFPRFLYLICLCYAILVRVSRPRLAQFTGERLSTAEAEMGQVRSGQELESCLASDEASRFPSRHRSGRGRGVNVKNKKQFGRPRTKRFPTIASRP